MFGVITTLLGLWDASYTSDGITVTNEESDLLSNELFVLFLY